MNEGECMKLPTSIENILNENIVECERVEFKGSWNPEPILHSICAFANDINNWGGGYILVGIEDDNGRPKYPIKGIEFIEADICDLSILGQKKYDGIVMAYIIQYLSKEEAEDLFVNLNKYLEQDTNLLIFLREGNSIVEETETINTKYKYILKEYTKEEIRKLLEKNGWEIIKMETKGYVEDPNTLSPDTLVVIAKHK